MNTMYIVPNEYPGGMLKTSVINKHQAYNCMISEMNPSDTGICCNNDHIVFSSLLTNL